MGCTVPETVPLPSGMELMPSGGLMAEPTSSAEADAATGGNGERCGCGCPRGVLCKGGTEEKEVPDDEETGEQRADMGALACPREAACIQ